MDIENLTDPELDTRISQFIEDNNTTDPNKIEQIRKEFGPDKDVSAIILANLLEENTQLARKDKKNEP